MNRPGPIGAGLAFAVLLLMAAGLASQRGEGVTAATAVDPDRGLRAPESFASIADERERARAMFEEIGRVVTSPRCVNCHPSGARPLQGDDGRPHEPKVVRGEGGNGVPGMRCSTCHMSENVRISEDFSVPGHPKWHLAPAEMAWEDRSLQEICEQIKDPERNGGMDLDELVHHMAEDGLVGWGWNPGVGREPAPGTQKELGELTRAWVDAGAHCPEAG